MIVDAVMLAAGVGIVAALSPTSSPTGHIPSEPAGWLVVFSLLVLVLFRLRGMYTAPLRLELTEALREIVSTTAIAAVLTMAVRVLVTNEPYVAAETVRHWLVAVPLLTAGRAGVLLTEARARRLGEAGRRTLIVGAGAVGRLAASRLISDPTLGLVPIGFLDDDPLDGADLTTDLPVYGLDEFEEVVADERLEHVIIAFSAADDRRLLDLTRRAWELGVAVSVVPRLFELEGDRAETEHLGGLPLVALRPADPHVWQFRLKYALDRVVAAVLVCVAMPVLLAAMAAVWLSMGRPIFFRQQRVGRDGRVFSVLKLRTLRDAAEGHEADAEWAAAELGGEMISGYAPMEARVGRVGHFLRRSAIDELPQLWNVVRGDMSLVGPRPERVSYAERFGDTIYRYSDRQRVKSGLTGLAQVHGLRGKSSLRDRIEWDNHYIENWSPWLDLKILLKTLPALLRVRGGEAPEGASGELEVALREGEPSS